MPHPLGDMQDLSRPWEDPLAEKEDRRLAQELRGTGLAGVEVPAWKAKALGKAPTFGKIDVRSIKDQRESLPVFDYRDQIIGAVSGNQVCSSLKTAGSGWQDTGHRSCSISLTLLFCLLAQQQCPEQLNDCRCWWSLARQGLARPHRSPSTWQRQATPPRARLAARSLGAWLL